eukprot:6459964-Amphidinium_carterae.1
MKKSQIAPQKGAPKKSAWIDKHKKLREEAGVDASESWVKANAASIRGVRGDSQRALDVIDLCYQIGRKQGLQPNLLASQAIADLSQDGSRKAWSYDRKVRSLTTSSDLFSFSRRRSLCPPEHMLLLGFVEPKCTVSATAVRDLSGEAMGPPVVGTLATALLTSLPQYWQ